MKSSSRPGTEAAAGLAKVCRRIGNTVIDALYATRIASGRRKHRPWLALVAVPLAMTTCALLTTDSPSPFAAWPLLLALAWWWYPVWRWGWVLSFELGVFGTQWAVIGAYGLRDLPGHRLLVEVVWTGYAATVAALGVLSRRG